MINPLVTRILVMGAIGGAVYLLKSKKGKDLLAGFAAKKEGHDDHAGCDRQDHAHGGKDDEILSAAKSKLKDETLSN